MLVSVPIILTVALQLLPPLAWASKERRLPGRFKRDDRHCAGNGLVNDDNTCSCYSGWRGANCTLRYCPFGKSWVEFPVENHKRYRPEVECSNMGSCDLHTGRCLCRPGFEGRACERMSCPSAKSGATCSGHGRCLTMADAAFEFNGQSLIRPSIAYTGWDADSIQGCVCDLGYAGYDCSERRCPEGRDPLASGTVRYEAFTLVCGGQSGSFNIEVLGYATPALSVSAGPAALKDALEAIPGLGSVKVTTDPSVSTAMLCPPTSATTTITLLEYAGPPLRMRVSTGRGANNRENPTDGATALGPSGSTALLMKSTYTLYCPVCPSCDGNIFFSYENGLSVGVPVDTSVGSATTAIKNALLGIPELVNSEWDNLDIEVTVSGSDASICGAAARTFTITVKSDYGNLPLISLAGSKVRKNNGGSYSYTSLTWSETFSRQGDVLPCSGQGLCDTKTGRCSCTRYYRNNTLQFEMQSSNGVKGLGNRGDCGYYYKSDQESKYSQACGFSTNSTGVNEVLCSGHGACLAELSDACTCYEGWSGILCDFAKECPSGPAWFDEAISATVAHQPAVCSNMGSCDRTTGTCKCRPGYYGDACQYMDCPRDSATGEHCGGHGWCLSMHEWAEEAGFQYGVYGDPLQYPDTWDAFGFHHCLCSAGHPSPYSLSTGTMRRYPTVGPRDILNGKATETPSLPGYRGWSCEERNCPSGNRIVSPTTDSSAEATFEVQRVVCVGAATTSAYFTLSFYGHDSLVIKGDMLAADIKAAIEWPPTVRNVSISFPRFATDGIQTACAPGVNAVSGGFLVNFYLDLGDLPLLEVESQANAAVTVTEKVKGTLTNEECGGLNSGICNRKTGVCECHGRFMSSNGTDEPGSRGDCGHYYRGVVDVDYI